VVTVASRTLQTQAWGFGVDPARVTYLPNGPDSHMRQQADVSDEAKSAARAHLGVGDAPLALYLGTIPHGSDLDLALDAFSRIRHQLPDARLVIAGQGDGIPALQAQAEKIGIADRVVFPGWIEQERVPIYLAAADVTVNPYRDTLINRSKCAIKVVAAMAMGKAVVTSRVGENLEYIVHGQCGLLTEAGNPGDLAEALLAVLTDRRRTRELGLNARRRIWEVYDWDVRSDILEDVYRLAVEHPRRGR
jgi:glycosyltransferase involved in cell wall biosynthesis